MRADPEVSVVMSVYNGAERLRKSIDSILAQEGVEFEFVVVNDGSTDDCAKILEEYAFNDKRVRTIHQQNMGLTKALIKGCSEARGEYIVRHDAGDISFPERLKKQLLTIKEYPGCALVSCGTKFVGPHDEHLYDVIQDQDKALSGLMTTKMDKIRGPSHHGSTLFSKKIYELVGGYRSQFYFAQDLDLWTRLAEHGGYVILPEILYQAVVTEEAISGRYRRHQIASAGVILECARLRRRGMDESPALRKAAAIKRDEGRRVSGLDRARALYFIGTCLRRQGNPAARAYFRKAFRASPLHLRSAARMLFG